MGNGISSILSCEKEDPFSRLKGQLSKLGDRHPFGDDEILRIGRCHAYMESRGAGSGRSSGEDGSFLRAWATFCSTLPAADFKSMDTDSGCRYTNILEVDSKLTLASLSSSNSRRRKYISKVMAIVEEDILPAEFGDTLQQVAFTQQQGQVVREEDESIEMRKLDAFLNGAAECSRRGSRKALETMFLCCCDDVGTSRSNGPAGMKARPDRLLNLAYRLALASSLLTAAFALYDEATMPSDDDNAGEPPHTQVVDIDELLRKCPTPSFLPQDVGLEPIERSLCQYAQSNARHTTDTDRFATASTPYPSTDCAASSTADITISLDLFLQWSESSAPCLSACLQTFMHYIFFPDRPYPPSRTEFIFPDIKAQHSAFFAPPTNKGQHQVASRSSPLLFTLAAMSPSLGGAWHRLFTSDSDGLSFNRLQNALLGYDGPTLLILQESSPSLGIFGAFTSTRWKEAKDFYGNSDCFLFRIQPSVAVYRPRGRSGAENYMYCNSESRSKGYDGLSHGIGFGGTVDRPRLFIAETLEGCTASAGDLTFETGPLLPPPEQEGEPSRKYFDMYSCEIWGVGGDDVVQGALGAREAQREIVASNINKARKVDKAQFLDDFKSGLIQSKAFQHREQMRGRDDCQIDDEDTNNYKYEK